MQVILIKSVRKLGKVGELVNVKNGYGRNFLIPQDLAIRATKDNLAKFATIQHDLETKNNQTKVTMEATAKALNGKHLTFVTQSGADGRLFGSISLKLLAASVSEMAGYKLNYSNIILDNPIKFNGVYKVQVMLHPEIFATMLVVVAKSESEAGDALREYKEGGKKEKSDSVKEQELDAVEAESSEIIEDTDE
jgi:large subunit ribosomal protein L9